MLPEKALENEELNSFFRWYPLVKEVVPTPKTIMIPMKKSFDSIDMALAPLYNKNAAFDPEMQRLIDEANRAAVSLGGYPVFLRSDETSNKHEWIDTCFVANREQLSANIANILEFSEMSMSLQFRGIVVREFLKLPHDFLAFNGMPVSKEFRYFIKNGKVLCRHPYGFPSCMRNINVPMSEWMPKLEKLMTLEPETQRVLDTYALAISKAVEPLKAPDNYWSADFCFVKDREWMLTDMALGDISYHWGTCENAAPIMFAQYGDPMALPHNRAAESVNELIAKYKKEE